jgi:hypothetical protein
VIGTQLGLLVIQLLETSEPNGQPGAR